MNDLYEQALQAERDGNITEWLVNYLQDSGRNPVLAEGIQADGKYHTGFIEYPLHKLKILMGPDKSFRYYEDPEKYNQRVNGMVDSINQGWRPVPLIVTNLWNGGLELNDGAHRAEALKRCGYETYPTIVFLQTPSEVDEFASLYRRSA